jgi:hyaluronoglucosaminidase
MLNLGFRKILRKEHSISKRNLSIFFSCAILVSVSAKPIFERRGIVEGFFGPLWSMSHRARLFEFGAARGMNTYLYAPKDDPYHRERWQEPYPTDEWRELSRLIQLAKSHRIDFVYGFHPGSGLLFSDGTPIRLLLTKAERFYDAGVRFFAVLFDDIPSRLEHREDQQQFGASLAQAEGFWLTRILEQQPDSWTDVEWWICPSYYTEDPMLARIFGSFEPRFLETLAQHLPENVACFWTGPQVVSKKISLAHVKKIARQLKHRLILWDNYPVNDLAMSMEMHIGPLTGRDSRLPEQVYGYLNNPLLQESLSFIPLATCFDYASDPLTYDAEKSWRKVVAERFGAGTLEHWKIIRSFCERMNRSKDKSSSLSLSARDRSKLEGARRYLLENKDQRWFDEFQPWLNLLEKSLTGKPPEG